MKLLFALFLVALITANLIVKHFGVYGLWISSALLIPFDFIIRCVIHERLSGRRLLIALFSLSCLAALFTILINWQAKTIAIASVSAFSAAQITAGIFYQLSKRRSWFIKVNGSDLLAIITDSIIFQIIAFSSITWGVMGGQIIIKIFGGLLWYLIFFRWLRIQIKEIKCTHRNTEHTFTDWQERCDIYICLDCNKFIYIGMEEEVSYETK